jgi:hypothetical protein
MRVVWCPDKGLLEEYNGRVNELLAMLKVEHKEEDVVTILRIMDWSRK